MKNPREIFNINDKWGNTLSLDTNYRIHIEIKGKSYMIGLITTSKLPFIGYNYWKQEKESDTFRMTDAWSIGYEILVRLGDGHVIVDTEIGRYNISAKEALKKGNGSFLHFKKSGVERKLYIPKNLFTFIKTN